MKVLIEQEIEMNAYDFQVKTINGSTKTLAEYKGKVLLLVNTASKCGFTPQYAELEQLYLKYKEKGLEILAFPCDQFAHQEPGTDAEIQTFCQVNYGVTFPIFSKINVNGRDAHPLFVYLRSQKKSMLGNMIKWNFTKFLIDRNGNFVARYEPAVKPLEIEGEISKLL
jgi:glutathione peroxidase